VKTNPIYRTSSTLTQQLKERRVIRDKRRRQIFLEIARDEAEWAEEPGSREAIIRGQLYNAIDTDKNGKISKDELARFFMTSEIPVSGRTLATGVPHRLDDHEFNAIWNAVDTDGDGWVDRSEFLILYIYFHQQMPDWVETEQKRQLGKHHAMLGDRLRQASKALEDAQKSADRASTQYEKGHLPQDKHEAARSELQMKEQEQDKVRQTVANERRLIEHAQRERLEKHEQHLALKRKMRADLKHEEAQDDVLQEQLSLGNEKKEPKSWYDVKKKISKQDSEQHITEICLVKCDLRSEGSAPINPAPPGWSFVPKNLGHGTAATHATYLCYKCQEGERPITALWVVTDKSSTPNGFQKLRINVNDVEEGRETYLCYSYDTSIDFEKFGYHAAPITDIQVIVREIIMGVKYAEEAPPGYIPLTQDLNYSIWSDRDHWTPQMYLCFAQDSNWVSKS